MFYGGGWHSYLRYDEEQERPDIDRALLRRVWGYSRPYRFALAGVLVTVLVISALQVVPPILIRLVVDEAIPEADLGQLTWLGIGMIAVPLIVALVGVMQRWWSSRAGEGIIFDLRCQLFAHLQRMSLRFFTATKTGELISRLNNDVVGAQQAISGTFVTILSNLTAVIAIVVVMLGADWRLTLLAVAALPLFLLPARRVGRILRRVTERQMEHNASMSAILQETFNVSGALLVKLFGREGYEADRYGIEADQVRRWGVRRAMVGRWFFAALGLVGAVGTATVFWVGGWLVIQEDISLGTVVMFSSLLVQLYSPLSALSNSRVELATSLVSFERVFEVMDIPLDLPVAAQPVQRSPTEGEIVFEQVWFQYQTGRAEGLDQIRHPVDHPEESVTSPSRPWALSDLSFQVKPGQIAALVGPSGAGKTTIGYLVPRLYDVTQGSVLVDGVDVRQYAPESLSQAIAMVTQETYLFHDTIAANLRYARLDATQTELEEACQAANIHQMILELPDGYQTTVGERGYRLSGGEKQRIAIARAILNDAPILILDEATSHLDSHSESLIQEALERVMRGRTSLVIAHRLSTVRSADHILVLDEGRLVEQGNHDELLELDGLYAKLFQTQFQAAVQVP